MSRFQHRPGLHRPLFRTDRAQLEGEVPFLGHLRIVRARLSNGLRVILLPDPAAPVVAVQSWFHVGSRYEREGLTGIAHLFEHLMFKETSHLPEGAFSRILEETGARDFNAWTLYDQTVYTVAVPRHYLELVFQLESDRMANLVLNERQLASEREVVLNEWRYRSVDDPFGRMAEAMNALAFEVHPYRWPVIGRRCDIESITLEDCFEFYRAYYSPNNCTLLLCGDLAVEPTLELLERYYGEIPAQEITPPRYPPEPEQRGLREEALELQLETEVIQLGMKVPGLAHPDRAALHLLDVALAHGRTSRLERLLVDPGLASSVDAMMPPMAEPGLYEIQVTLREGHRAEEARERVFAELDRLARDGITEAELARARRRYEVGFHHAMRDNCSRANVLGLYELAAGGCEQALSVIEQVRAVRPEDIQRVAASWLTTDGTTVITARPTRRAGLHLDLAGEVPLPDPQEEALEEGLGEAMADHLLGEEDGLPLEAVREEAELALASMGLDALPFAHLTPQLPASPWVLQELPMPRGGLLFAVEEHTLPLFTFQLLLPGGCALETSQTEGGVNLMGELLLRGTRTRSRTDFEDALDDLGASLEISVETDHLLLTVSGLAAEWHRVLELVEEALITPALDAEQLESLRGELLGAIQERRNDDKNLVDYWFSRLLLPDHPYGRSSLGTLGALGTITLETVRELYRAGVHGSRALAGVSGALPVGEVGEWLAALLSRLPEGPEQALRRLERPVPSEPGTLYLIDKPERTQTQIVLGHLGIAASDPDYPLLLLANTAFGGGGSTSRLMLEVREKRGWSYGAFSQLGAGRDGGTFHLWVFPAMGDASPCLTLVRDLYADLAEGGVTEVELEYARRSILNGAAFDEETPERCLQGALIDHWLGRDRKQMLTAVAAATREAVGDAIRRHLGPERLMGTMVCTAAGLEAALRDSGLFARVQTLAYTQEAVEQP